MRDETQHQLFSAAIDAILADAALAQFHSRAEQYRAALAPTDNPLEQLPRIDRNFAALVNLQISGTFSNPEPTPFDPTVEDTNGPIDVEAALAAARLPPIEEAIASLPQEGVQAGAVTTFIFVHDPQINGADGMNGDNERVKKLNQVIDLMNESLEAMTWPAGTSVAGTPIGNFDGVFFGGDLCQTGGGYNFIDQSNRLPAQYKGGWEMETMRAMFQRGFVQDNLPWFKLPKTKVNRLDFGPSYFGLGNHDVQSEGVPSVEWKRSIIQWEPRKDYWRWQSWNFIAQMHSGVVSGLVKANAVYPVSAIDAGSKFSNNWKKNSFNYRVELGPVTVFQVHVYGGDSDNGRDNGLDWLRTELEQLGTIQPVIIVQHYPFAQFSQISPHWTAEQRNAFLEFLEPYNVVALLTGHIHGPMARIPETVTTPVQRRTFDEFRPGSLSDSQRFAVLRVSKTTFDIAIGGIAANATTLQWSQQYTKALPPQPAVRFDPAIPLGLGETPSVVLQNSNGVLFLAAEPGSVPLVDQYRGTFTPGQPMLAIAERGVLQLRGQPAIAATAANTFVAVARLNVLEEPFKVGALTYCVGTRASDGSINWTAPVPYDNGTQTSLASNGDGAVLEVHRGSGDKAKNLYARVGVVAADARSVSWGKSKRFDTGSSTAVAMNIENLCIQVHRGHSKKTRNTIFYRVGSVDTVNKTVQWGPVVPVNQGIDAAIALNDRGDVVMVYQDSNDDLFVRAGTLNSASRSIAFAAPERSGVTASGIAVSLDNSGFLIQASVGGNSKVYYRVGEITPAAPATAARAPAESASE